MKIRSIFEIMKIFALGLGSVIPNYSSAAMCVDTVMEVIFHASGKVYFTTPNSCSQAWCEISGNAQFVKNATAALMAAKIKETQVVLQWPNLPTCNDKNPAYSIPEYVVLR